MGLIDTISRRRGPARRQAGGGHHAGLLRAFGALAGPALAGAATLAIAFGAGADDPRSPARNLPALPQATACLAGAFLPNPVASSGDAALLFSLFRLQREVQDVSLPARLRITDGQLADDWVRLVSDSGGAYLDGATCGDLGFDWTDPRFAYVTAYATLARTADWAIATGLEDALPRALTVQVSETRPDSRYDADTRRLQLGSRQCGDVACRCDPDQGQCPIASDGRTIWPDAQDGDVVVHEYGHAILHHVLCADQPGCRLPRGRFVPVLDEAFADYLAVASAPGQKTDALCLGEWFYAVEGGTGPCLRWLDATAPWPESARGLAAEQPYSYATLWTSALLRARAALPEGVMDRIVVAAYRHLPDNRTPEQLAAQVVAEAQDAGRDAQATIASILTEAGFLDIRAPEAQPVGPSRHVALDTRLDLRRATAFPAYSDTHEIAVPGATAIALDFERIRVKPGDCQRGSCGRLLVFSGTGRLHDVIRGRADTRRSVTVPGDRVILRFVASYDHPRNMPYHLTGAEVWGTPR